MVMRHKSRIGFFVGAWVGMSVMPFTYPVDNLPQVEIVFAPPWVSVGEVFQVVVQGTPAADGGELLYEWGAKLGDQTEVEVFQAGSMAKIAELRLAGLSQREIAKELGIKRIEVRKYLDTAKPDQGVRAVLALPDIHVPYHDTLTMKSVLTYAASRWWDDAIILGDLLDFDFISRFTRDTVKRLSNHNFACQYAAGKDVLDAILKAVRKHNKSCRVYYIEGNHEARIHAYIERVPEAENIIEVPRNMDLDSRGVVWVPQWSKNELVKIGKAYFIHGHRIAKYHAFHTVLAYGHNVFYGHTHDVQTYSLERFGENDTIAGQSLGCLCSYDQAYMRGRPSNWQQAFGVFYFFDDGTFVDYVPRIFNHRFISPEGNVYECS